jgi:ABC-type transporter Mla subunit MlaD
MLRQNSAKLSREEHMISGIMVLVLAIAVLAVLWAIVLYGSTFFGPRTD